IIMHSMKTTLNGDPNVGLYGLATDRFAIISDDNAERDKISSVLGVPVIVQKVAGISFAGIFIAANSNAVLVPSIMKDRELEHLKKEIAKTGKDIEVRVIDAPSTALGNLIICNDRAAMISKLLEKHKDEISSALKVPVCVSDFMDLSIIGSLCIATNKGFLLNMHAEKEDFETVEKHMIVEGDIGTVNFGTPFVKSGLIVNSKGYIAGNLTTGPEITRIDEAFGFIKY
ncbi:MAG: translation initiation factor IF-6, partial [archaeon]|nr:translation initiation factor IF-6 [archaeon]